MVALGLHFVSLPATIQGLESGYVAMHEDPKKSNEAGNQILPAPVYV